MRSNTLVYKDVAEGDNDSSENDENEDEKNNSGS